jgi:hypothetical protein
MSYIGREPQVGNFQVCDAISVVNGQAAYTMQVSSVNVSPETANHMLVSLNGILQRPGSSFTVSNSTITFASNLVTGDVINFIHILGSVLDLGVPSDGTVTNAKLVSALQVGKETMWIPASAMYGATTNGADPQQVETTAVRPDMKVLDFDAGTDEFAQFSVAFPKSWNEGTVTYQVFWTPASTNTGDCRFGLQGVSCGDNDTIDVAYGTAVTVTDAGIGTVEDQQVSAESSAVTIAGSPAVDQLTYFQLYRDANAGGDTFSADARVLGIKIFFTTDAANDA